MEAEERVLPRYWRDDEFGFSRRGVPVVGVSWYEASAYCKWVQRHWDELMESRKNPGMVPERVRLPLEKEWTHAAGGVQPEDRYPWGHTGGDISYEEEILRRANVYENQISRTTSVGMYPLGGSQPYGLYDLGGNVWEWQVNYFDKDHRFRELRGGSWYDYTGAVLLPARDKARPDISWFNLGFRVVVLHSFSSRQKCLLIKVGDRGIIGWPVTWSRRGLNMPGQI